MPSPSLGAPTGNVSNRPERQPAHGAFVRQKRHSPEDGHCHRREKDTQHGLTGPAGRVQGVSGCHCGHPRCPKAGVRLAGADERVPIACLPFPTAFPLPLPSPQARPRHTGAGGGRGGRRGRRAAGTCRGWGGQQVAAMPQVPPSGSGGHGDPDLVPLPMAPTPLRPAGGPSPIDRKSVV